MNCTKLYKVIIGSIRKQRQSDFYTSKDFNSLDFSYWQLRKPK